MRVISTRMHAITGLVVGVVLIFAPEIFGFNDVGGAAESTARIIGVLLLLSELMTNNGLSPLKVIPMKVHLMMDVLAGLVLALSPWLFGFSDDGTNAWVPHLIVGLLVAGYAFITKNSPDGSRAAEA